MKYLFKPFIILFAFTWCVTLLAQQKGINSMSEVSPYRGPVSHDPGIEAIWDVRLNFDVTALSGAAGNAGAEWDGTYFYSTRWASNLLHKYDATGTTMIEQFSIPGVTGLRDLAFDGTYMYGGAAANTIYQMDFVTKTLIGTIPSPVAVRFIAYDEANDAFWVGNWTDPATLVSRTGATLATITTGLVAQYGAAYDNVSPGGPYLWIFNQDNTAGGIPQLIHQFDIATGTATGVTHDVMSDIGIGNTTAIAGGLFSMSDFATGLFTIGGLLQGAPDEMFVYEVATTGPPCPVGAPINPSPVNGAIDVPVSGNTATWTNGAGTSQVEVWFGEVGNLAQVYNGPAISSFSLASVEPLSYLTDYGWKIVCWNDTCSTQGPTWTFTTIQDPNLATLFCDDFTAGLGNWTITNDGGVCLWAIYQASEYTMPPTAVGNVMSADADACNGTAGNAQTTATHNGIDASLYQTVWLEFDNDWQAIDNTDFAIVDVSIDGGATWQNVLTWNDVDVRNTHELWDLTSLVALSNFSIRFKSVQPGWDWWWAVDNICIYGSDPIPVELTSFTAIANIGVVELSWITATETNNQGFEVQRSSAGEFETIAFVAGYGTTTEPQAYSYTDRSVNVGSNSYRLKQVDFDGTFKYSNVIEVNVSVPAVFALEQNYPNPFNPSTQIAFRLAVDSKVSLKVFDVLGQEVATLVNTNLVAGAHNVNFDASSLNSGVYFYRIEATGIDGTNFVDVKKMILMK